VTWKLFTPLGLFLVLAACGDQDAVQQRLAAALKERGVALEAELRRLNDEQVEDESGLLVQLAFGAEADLDLYVTDPLLETVYFANKEGKSGGAISDDRRCDSLPLRVEEVYFEAPLGGPYRVGVDYPNRCDDNEAGEFAQRAAFTLSVLHNGKRRYINGSVGYRFFEVAVFDFAVDTRNNKESWHELPLQ
jgi:hypothetical protein